MFTGIIEELGTVISAAPSATGMEFAISAPFTAELRVDQSIAHNGVCLTVTAIKNDVYYVTAIAETLTRSNLGGLKAGDHVNLERCLIMNGRLDGHIVQGHVDVTGICESITDAGGSWIFRFSFPEKYNMLLVEKGSVCVNGVSLTVVDVEKEHFSVAVIPYTFEHTNFGTLKKGSSVNIEFDILGKYVLKAFGKIDGER
ncbi:MAG TPA: riboflavin synthase [Bacteroidia bacterium]|nr:riboflavin synthase [Bacteroidia bacterium]